MSTDTCRVSLAAAERLVSREEDEELWLELRRTMVTASESAHLLGLLKHRDYGLLPDELAAKKRSAKRTEVGGYAHAGAWWERPNLEWLCWVTGMPAVGTSSLFRSKERPYMGATPDGVLFGGNEWGGTGHPSLLPFLHVYDDFDELVGAEALERLRDVLGGSELAVLELKHQRSWSRNRWNKPLNAPPEYINQVRHQTLVCGADIGLLVAKVGANELYAHIVERDAAQEALLLDACEDFAEKYLSGA